MASGGEERHVGCPRQRVIHVGSAQQLAFGVVDGPLDQRLADALDDAAVHLALDQHRIDDGAEIVDRGIFDDLDHAGFRIDRSVPAMTKRPAANSMSVSAASSTKPAIFLPRSITSSDASTIAVPVAVIDRDPPVPPPNTSSSLSPWMSRMRSNGMPSRSLSTCANGAAWPWP